jgi:hypothetical protein
MTKAKIFSLSIAAAVALGSSPSTLAANAACSRFQPGHYFYLSHESNGLNNLRKYLSLDVRNFQGVVYFMNWGTIEKSKGVYDFGPLDAALAQARAKGKYFMLEFRDRTFHWGCNSNFVPSYVPREKSATLPNTCYAKIWETATSSDRIRVLKAVATRYKNDRAFMGIALPESSINPTSFVINPDQVALAHYEQLKRTARELNAVAPSQIIHQKLNWPRGGNINHFTQIADTHVGLGGGGSVGWPDTSVPNQYNWNWYNIGRNYRYRIAIMPQVQTSGISSSLAEHDRIYRMLNDDIRAHMIVWGTWHKDMSDSYFSKVIIPTVNKYNGAVSNRSCPF